MKFGFNILKCVDIDFSISGLIEGFLYEWENLKRDYPLKYNLAKKFTLFQLNITKAILPISLRYQEA